MNTFTKHFQNDNYKAEIDVTLKENNNLSISGGIWEKARNNRWIEYSFGQCQDTIQELFPNNKKIKEIVTVWNRWHLNDMRPNCAHQVGPAWEPKDVKLYNFTTKMSVYNSLREAEKRARLAIEQGCTFEPTSEETRLANLKSSLVLLSPDLPLELQSDYEPKKDTNYSRFEETKSTNWLSEKKHPEGYLSKPCPVCGYKYGSAWLTEEIPADVIKQIKSWDS